MGIAYCAQAWALRYAPASLASFYATAQPIMATLVTSVLLVSGVNPNGALSWPSWELLGAGFVVAGLLVEELGSRKQNAQKSINSESEDDPSSTDSAESADS